MLLKGGTVLVLNEGDRISAIKADILIEGPIVSRIEPSISVTEGCEIIDCTDKIISPGFVDTHRHFWETSLKGICEDLTGVEYFATKTNILLVFTSAFTFKPRDVFWGNLSGCLEAIDAGTTTALDFAHVNWTKEHAKEALAGTLSSGIRSIFALAPTVTLKSAEPEPELGEMLPEWFMPLFEELASSEPIRDENSRVRMGLGFDFFHLPKDVVLDVFQRARSSGANIATCHWARFKGNKGDGLPQLLKSYGLLDERIVFSHMGGLTSDDADLLQKANAFISASPSTEMTMGLGPPACFRDDLPGLDSVCSLGVDCHCVTSGSMVNEMRVGLLAARELDSAEKLRGGNMPRSICRTAHDAFLMATIQGARALNMEGEVGSIAVGTKADLVIFDASSPSMAVAAQLDPVKAIVMHSNVGDIDTVLVDGVVKKRNGKLLPTQLVEWKEANGAFLETGEVVRWRDAMAPVLDTQRRFLSRLPEFDIKSIQKLVLDLYGM